MENTREVKMSKLRNWLDNEEVIIEEYNSLEKALEEVENIYYSDNEDDDEIEVNSKELTSRGYKVLSRNEIRTSWIDTSLDGYKDELREQLLTIDLYKELQCGSQEVVSDEVKENEYGAIAVTIEELKKGDSKLRVIYEYELLLTDEHKNKLKEMTDCEKHQYIVENGDYLQ